MKTINLHAPKGKSADPFKELVIVADGCRIRVQVGMKTIDGRRRTAIHVDTFLQSIAEGKTWVIGEYDKNSAGAVTSKNGKIKGAKDFQTVNVMEE